MAVITHWTAFQLACPYGYWKDIAGLYMKSGRANTTYYFSSILYIYLEQIENVVSFFYQEKPPAPNISWQAAPCSTLHWLRSNMAKNASHLYKKVRRGKKKKKKSTTFSQDLFLPTSASMRPLDQIFFCIIIALRKLAMSQGVEWKRRRRQFFFPREKKKKKK